jgi:hypothetical protein
MMTGRLYFDMAARKNVSMSGLSRETRDGFSANLSWHQLECLFSEAPETMNE